ncbi:hypothetical protein TMatcc_000530 [Talaromyces marneffei ATCC 18224]|uniref:DNA replication regulator Sld3 C-terminal domain-containing protein n=1 Tax=Talaromyces marneffei (strain ATCC 18224 / CBS 334.59 / QM 7333) TaxID=441960 RepID=B6QS51_TALMQ|nr:uncharacterized protein EYB26_003104 [Talaromyces marneffei]EEA20544.1 conserved hypothetical protein [Talaromyces marneffei ATCC 18224]QGA15446.1 hypothetical protein EYB26_003104 [Talaromyces marneffei]
MASRGISGILESTSLTSLNAINGPSASLPPLKRRKIFHADDVEQTFSAQTVFTVKGHASSLSDNEYKLAPIELLPRSALPFSWLDTSTAIQSNNIFASNDAVLEGMFFPRNDAGVTDTEPSVLATRSLSNGAIYAVERVKTGIFAMTKLQSHIEEGEIRVAAKAAAAINLKRFSIWSSSTDLPRSSNSTNGWDWREAARLPDDIPRFDPFATKGKFDASVVFEDCSGNDHDAVAESQVYTGDSFMALDGVESGMQEHTRTPPENNVQAPPPEAQGDAQDTLPTPDVIMENLRTQYLETLYISKTSVAYFAKGPLTRCRNAFAQYSPKEDVPSLSSQYRESILSVKKMDAKYRETLPVILRNMALLLSDDERPKKRKSKKKKLGKNGLYTGEDEFLQKYWKSRQVSKNKEGLEESKDEEIKRHVSDLRLRETQLQILLILETIHLELTTVTPSIEDSKGQEIGGSSTKRSKSKKEENLNLLLELFIDRLCIWHAISAGEGVIAESLKETTNNHLSGKKIESDALRDFCNEVIIPFYASRLPEQCKTIKKKLGGASEVSPSRPAPKLKASTSASGLKNQFGVANSKKTQPQQKPRRMLQRVLTDEQISVSQRSRHPSLLRSSTTPALQEVKRESVEPSLPSLGGSVRGGIQIARRVDKREVDLNAAAKVHEAKLKKMNTLIEQKKELDAAINALRKPNRELVSKEVADQAEKRTLSSSRKSKNPVRNPLGQGVQVMATPRGTRKKDMSVEHQSQPSLPRGPFARPSSIKQGEGADEASPELGSDISLVPGSTIRTNTLTSSVTSKRKFNSITETPSRGVSRRSGPLSLMDDHEAEAIAVNTPASSIPCNRALFKVPTLPAMTARPVDERRPEPENTDINSEDKTFSINQTPPAKNKIFFTQQQLSAPKAMTTPSSPVPGFETPIKAKPKQKVMPQDDSAQVVQSTPVKSIYEALGWDDDDDLAL